mgnify:CR=1 FL=1
MSYEYHKPESDQTEEDIISEKRILHDSNLIDRGAKIKDGRLEVTDYQRKRAEVIKNYEFKKGQAIESIGGKDKYDELVLKVREIPESLTPALSDDVYDDGRHKFIFKGYKPNSPSDENEQNLTKDDYSGYNIPKQGFPIMDMRLDLNLSKDKFYKASDYPDGDEYEVQSGPLSVIRFGLTPEGKLRVSWEYLVSSTNYIGNLLDNSEYTEIRKKIDDRIKELFPGQEIEFLN